MVNYPIPRAGLPSGTVQWSDGTNFNGSVWIAFTGMQSGSATWGSPALPSGRPIASQYLIQIIDGKYDGIGGVFYNADVVPPGTAYVANYYDSTNTPVGSQTAQFSVTASTFTIPSVTLTPPIIGTIPTPAP